MSILPRDPDSKSEALDRAYALGMRAVSEMAFDWYCPWQANLPRRRCPDCTAKVALDSAVGFLRGAV